MLKRTLSRLTRRPFDLLVIGGTHLGHFIAWDATLRGLKVALICSGDFGANSNPVGSSLVRGGFRFLEGDSLALNKQMVQERQAFLRIAPHLVRPLPHLLVTKKQHSATLWASVNANRLLNYQHNFSLDPDRTLAHGRFINRRQLVKQHPFLIDSPELGAGAIWDEAQIVNPQRLQFSILKSAVDSGAVVANYLQVKKLRTYRRRVVGVEAIDELDHTYIHIGAKVVVDATEEAIGRWGVPASKREFSPNISLYLLTRQLESDQTIQFIDGMNNEDQQQLSIVPWQGCSLIGPFQSSQRIEWGTTVLLKHINEKLPSAQLKPEDIYKILSQSTPVADEFDAEPSIIPETQIINHAKNEGLYHFISARSPKFESSRYVAEKTVDLLFAKLQRATPHCRTRQARLSGGKITHWHTFEHASIDKWPIEMPPYQIRRYLTHYGSQHRTLLPILAESQGNEQPIWEDTDVTKAEIIFAIRNEMAQTLADVVLRRTEMGATLPPSLPALQATARLMASECGWSEKQINQEVDTVLAMMNLLEF